MYLKNTLLKFVFAYLFFSIHSSIAIANAPIDPTGHKIALKVTNSVDSEGNVDSEEETHIQYFTSITTALNRGGNNGQWYPESISWTKYSHTEVKLLLGVITDSYADLSLNFQNTTTGTFTFDYYDSDNGLPLKKVSSGSGIFTFSVYENSVLPFDHYFNDSFDDYTVSSNLWPIRTHAGITTMVKDGKFLISGTDYDLDDRWQGINANSILSLKEDWVVEGTAFNKRSEQQGKGGALVGVDAELEEGGFSFDISIGKGGTDTILAEIYVESFNSFSDQYTSIWTDSLANEEDFRLINTSSSSTIYAQYFANGKWNTLSEINWKTGVVTEKNTYTGDESTHEFANWVNPELSLVAPFMDFVMPNYYDDESGADQILPLAEGDLGFSSFSVSEGMPEVAINYVPDSFQNLKLTVHWETESGESGTNLNYVIDEDTVKIHHLYGTSDAFWAEESFTWEESGHNTMSSTTTNADGRVVTGTLIFQDADSGTFELKFYESENGQLVYQESGSGTFTIEEYSPAELPSSKGWMWFDHYPWVYSHVEGGWLYFYASGSKLMVYSVVDETWREME